MTVTDGPAPALGPSAAERSASGTSVGDSGGGPVRSGSPLHRVDLAKALGFVLALVGFVVGARPIFDNSFLTHLATGQLILAEGSVPTADVYSYLAAGQPWTVQSWLASVVYAGLDATLGGWSIRVVNGLAGAGLVIGMWRLVAPARQLLARVGLVGVALVIGASLWSARPLLFGLFALMLTLQVVQGLRSRWWLVPVFWFWINLHGSFVLGVGLVGAVVLGAFIDQRRLPTDELRTLAAAAVGVAAAVINPLGWRLLWFPFQFLGGRGDALEGVGEWKSPTFRSPVEALFLVLVPLLVVAARRGAPWRALLPSLAFVAAGLLAVRNIGLAAVVVAAMVAPSLRDLGGTVDGAATGLIPRALAALALSGGLLAAVAVASSAPIDLDGYPVDEVDWLEDRDLVAQPDVRLAEREYVGNYLTLRYGREARVFMDDRFDFHPLTVLDDHRAMLLGGDLDEIMERNQFDVVLWASEGPTARWLRRADDWAIVRADDDWLIACRRSSPVAARCGLG